MDDLPADEFTVSDLGRVRAMVADAARLVGLGRKAIEGLVLAVSEIATNAVRHAGGRGSIRIKTCARGISVVISDNGPGLPADVTGTRPEPGSTSGRGLWIARQMCDRMNVSSNDRGVTIDLVALVP